MPVPRESWCRARSATRRFESALKRGLLLSGALIVPGKLWPEGMGNALIETLTSCDAERIAGFVTMGNALTLMP
jgi:hypothetical protein